MGAPICSLPYHVFKAHPSIYTTIGGWRRGVGGEGHSSPSRSVLPSHDLQFLDNEGTSIEATRASFRWVLDNGEGRPPEDAYKDVWLLGIGDEDSESDEMSSYGDSAGGGS